MAVADKVKSIIVEQLGVDEEEVTPDASFVDDLGADLASIGVSISRNPCSSKNFRTSIVTWSAGSCSAASAGGADRGSGTSACVSSDTGDSSAIENGGVLASFSGRISAARPRFRRCDLRVDSFRGTPLDPAEDRDDVLRSQPFAPLPRARRLSRATTCVMPWRSRTSRNTSEPRSRRDGPTQAGRHLCRHPRRSMRRRYGFVQVFPSWLIHSCEFGSTFKFRVPVPKYSRPSHDLN